MKSNQKIRLVENGIFPIIKNHKSELLDKLPNTNQKFAGTFQGEGKLIGIPVLFIRTAGCNLRCIWEFENGDISICDTENSSFNLENSEYIPVQQVVETIAQNLGNLQHIVISGGEPILQNKALVSLCYQLKHELNVHITIETNATIFDYELALHVDFFSLSPKLISSTPNKEKIKKAKFPIANNYPLLHEKRRLNIEAIQQFINCRENITGHDYDFQLKFVVASENEEQEIKDILKSLSGWKNEDIILMPLGKNKTELLKSTQISWKMAVRNGWRFSPRLHIDLFGDVAGV